MTDPDRKLDEVPALIEERRRYEQWLDALDARRDTTPKHVFERVQTDYRERLRRVEERLAAHRQSIEEEQTSLASRLSLLKAEEQLRRDERAELELRTHVGELSGNEAEEAFRAVDEVIENLVVEKAELDRRLAALSALLEVRPREAPAPAAVTTAAPPPVAAQASAALESAGYRDAEELGGEGRAGEFARIRAEALGGDFQRRVGRIGRLAGQLPGHLGTEEHVEGETDDPV